jgi:glycosyltransferase involved in cell wall biosynthesis
MQEQRPEIAALIPYPVYPAKMGGQKGIALFYSYLLEKLPVKLLGIKEQEPEGKSGAYFEGIMSGSRIRYTDPLLVFRLRNYIHRNRIKTFIIEHPYFGWLAWMLKKITGVKIVVHSHNIESLRFRSTGKYWWKIMAAYEGWTHRFADLSFFISPEDREWAIEHYHISKNKAVVIPYGSPASSAPDTAFKLEKRRALTGLHNIGNDERILLFNGTLDYKPNLDALKFILKEINPILLKSDLKYKIIICGKGLPADMKDLTDYRTMNIIYAGFVDDIDMYFMGSDIFLNPVFDGGGIKTKLVEALGADLNAVSSRNGSFGVPRDITGGKLKIVEEDTGEAYCNAIQDADLELKTPTAFYKYFYWGAVADKASALLKNL